MLFTICSQYKMLGYQELKPLCLARSTNSEKDNQQLQSCLVWF